ncbi:hypothetical protein B5E41_22265 [Rhizobium esperanzae]|uniref:Uncharacterized protein n=1 Tax=Rhizobium esperanzae TaxID=1967781 RepID=A0A246DQB3_9HYPH|nr:hypothetical protein B5E41_22265 [Rhizobium esperanzae]
MKGHGMQLQEPSAGSWIPWSSPGMTEFEEDDWQEARALERGMPLLHIEQMLFPFCLASRRTAPMSRQ